MSVPYSPAIDTLRDRLRDVEPCRLPRREALPFGIPDIDARLQSGGLGLNALHEVAGARPGIADEHAAMLFLAALAARTWGPVLWVVRRRDLFAPSLGQEGLMPDRILHAEARDDTELLQLMEEGLRHRGLGAVIGEGRRMGAPATRRLQQVAEGGRTIALLLRRHGRPGRDAAPFDTESAAATRWQVGIAPPVSRRGGRPRWHLSLAGGEGQDWTVLAPDDTGRCALPHTRHPVMSDGSVRRAA